MFKRYSGVLLHVSSLPSAYGVGDFGPGAYKFIDFLSQAKQRCWQILPLNPTESGYGNSPYSSPSAFAINPIFISPDELIKYGLLKKSDLPKNSGSDNSNVDYEKVYSQKSEILNKAYDNYLSSEKLKKEFEQFKKKYNYWLNGYATFVVIKSKMKGRIWTQWDNDLKRRDEKVLEKFVKQNKVEIEKVKFTQFLAYHQWNQVLTYAHSKGVQIIGDIPIYVSLDSADVWQDPKLFKLDGDLNPMVVAGVPPDYFSKTGQRWGNPVYDWDELAKGDFGWWIKRIEVNLSIFDIIRIDHFRGFVQYWEIPVAEETAINGEWANVPTAEFFTCLKKKFHALPIIAEDLGIITDDVRDCMRALGFPGMKILLFAFNGDLKDHPYLPHNYPSNCVVYTGTHDNNTVQGWYQNEATDIEKKNIETYLDRVVPPEEVHWAFIQLAMICIADLSIIPLQDILGLGQDCRMNKPATVLGNWRWRVLEKALDKKLADRLANLTVKCQRS